MCRQTFLQRHHELTAGTDTGDIEAALGLLNTLHSDVLLFDLSISHTNLSSFMPFRVSMSIMVLDKGNEKQGGSGMDQRTAHAGNDAIACCALNIVVVRSSMSVASMIRSLYSSVLEGIRVR